MQTKIERGGNIQLKTANKDSYIKGVVREHGIKKCVPKFMDLVRSF